MLSHHSVTVSIVMHMSNCSSFFHQGKITANDLKQRLGAFYKNLPVGVRMYHARVRLRLSRMPTYIGTFIL